ncbi:MAG: ferrous iron transport protein B [Lachnospiraceae bacterium]|nr:ferrous iron transport protein B [Lachnospiraceae bacterium]
MAIKIALAGNPNSGKTTLFNALTGANQYVGNWPGVTVEKKEGKLKEHKDVVLQDLPGIYSLSPYTLEEVVARNYLVQERPDAILNIVDGTNIERNLYLTTQLLELNIPVVVAINMTDLVKKNGDTVNIKKLSEELGCPVYELSALKKDGIDEVSNAAIDAANSKNKVKAVSFSDEVESAITSISDILKGKIDDNLSRWYSIKMFERDEKVVSNLSLSNDTNKSIESVIEQIEESLDDDSESIITNERYNSIANITKNAVKKKTSKDNMTASDRIDKIVTNRILGLPIFAVIMFLIYAVAMGGWPISIGTMGTDFTNDVIFGEWVPNLFDKILSACNVAEGSWLYGLIQDGIVAGFGAVIGFVPQMLVLFLFLSILEDVGYMARIAFVMDRIFRQFGLSGKSFIPVLVATGCGVPGIMASRTIENERDRKMTIMTTTFIPCGAKLPIIGLVAGALFDNSEWVSTSAFFIGIFSIILSGIILKKFKAFAGEPAPFVMELPSYHVPSVRNVLSATWERGWSFIKRASSVIVIASIIIWFFSAYGVVNGKFGMVDDMFADESIVTESVINDISESMDVPAEDVNAMDASLLAKVGNGASFLFKPLGFGSWKPTVATVTGLVAKEEVIGTFGVLYNYDEETAGEELGEKGEGIWERVADDYTPIAAFAFMIFNLLCAPCFAAIGAIKREMNNAKWTWAAIGYMTLWAYVLALIVYQLGGLISGTLSFGVGTVFAIVLLVGLIYLLFRKGYVQSKEIHNLTDVASDK